MSIKQYPGYTLYKNAYQDQESFLYWDGDGEASPGAARLPRAAFWDGYNGTPNRHYPRGSLGAAAWRAGRDCKDEEIAREEKDQ